MFLQFIDCVYQISEQFPCAFEFNEQFLVTILDHLYTGLFGTFLHNCVRERQEAHLRELTPSLWDMIVVDSEEWKNPLYSPVMHHGALAFVPSMSKLQLWKGYYLRWNPHMRPQECVQERTRELQRMCATLEAENAALRAELGGGTREADASHTQRVEVAEASSPVPADPTPEPAGEQGTGADASVGVARHPSSAEA